MVNTYKISLFSKIDEMILSMSSTPGMAENIKIAFLYSILLSLRAHYVWGDVFRFS